MIEVRPNDTIHIVEYNPNWPALYQQEQTLIAAALGEIATEIYHVGSSQL